MEKVSLETLLSESDFITLHMPSSLETSGFIGERELRAMRSTAFLINTARGPLVDEPALVDALRERRIAGAGLDVFVDEPRTDSPFAEFDNVIVSPAHRRSHRREYRSNGGIGGGQRDRPSCPEAGRERSS